MINTWLSYILPYCQCCYAIAFHYFTISDFDLVILSVRFYGHFQVNLG